MIRLTVSQSIPAWTFLFCYRFYVLTLHGAPSKAARLLRSRHRNDGYRPVLAVDSIHPWYGAFRDITMNEEQVPKLVLPGIYNFHTPPPSLRTSFPCFLRRLLHLPDHHHRFPG
jgi:hypothetical protein